MPLTKSKTKEIAVGQLCACCRAPGAELACSRCKRVRYCTRKCQKKHWKDGGHKKYCQAFPAVAAEMGVTVAAIDPVTNAAAAAPLASTDIEPLDPGAACWICLDGDEPGSKVRRGCACRGSNGGVHIACLVDAALSREGMVPPPHGDPADGSSGPYGYWTHCPTCKSEYAGAFLADLAAVRWAKVVGLAEDNPGRAVASGQRILGLLTTEDLDEAASFGASAVASAKSGLGTEHPVTLELQRMVADIKGRQGDLVGAEVLLRDTLTRQMRLSDTHAATAGTSMTYGALGRVLNLKGDFVGAVKLYRRQRELLCDVFGPDDERVLKADHAISVGLLNGTQHMPGLKLLKEVLAKHRQSYGRSHPKTLETVASMGSSLRQAGQHTEAINLLTPALPTMGSVLGACHQVTLSAKEDLGQACFHQGDTARGMKLVRQVLAARQRAGDAADPRAMTTANMLAEQLDGVGRSHEALAMYQETLGRQQRVLGSEHPSTLSTAGSVASTLSSLGRFADAIAIHRKNLVVVKKTLGDEHSSTLSEITCLAGCLSQAGRPAEAVALLRPTMLLRRRLFGEHHAVTLHAVENLCLSLREAGQLAESEKMTRELLQTNVKLKGELHPDSLNTANTLIGTLNRSRKYAEAIELSTKTLSGYQKVLGPDHPATLGSQMNLAALLGNTGSHNKSAALHRATLTSQTRVLGAQNPNALNTAVMLSVALTHLCANDELVKLLHRTIPMLRTVFGPADERTVDAERRLVSTQAAVASGESTGDIRVGCEVEVTGLKANAALNGQRGVVVLSPKPLAAGRVCVRFHKTHSHNSIKVTNLERL